MLPRTTLALPPGVAADVATHRLLLTGAPSTTGVNLLGVPVGPGAKPNRTVDVVGRGVLTVRRTVRSAAGLDVTGRELRLSTDRSRVQAGTVVEVAAGRSRATTT